MAGFLTSIRARLVLLALAAAIPALLAVLFTTVSHYREAQRRVELEALRSAAVIASREQAMIEQVRSTLALLSRNAAIGNDNPDGCAALLRDMYDTGVINASTLGAVSAVDAAGRVYCSSGPISKPVIVSDRLYIQRALETQRFTLGKVVVGRASGLPTVPAAYPVFDGSGAIEAVLVGGLNLQELAESIPTLPRGAAVTLLREDGLVLGRYPDSEGLIGQMFPDAPLVASLANAETAVVTDRLGIDGVERVYAIQPIGAAPRMLYAAIGFPAETVYAVARRGLVIGLLATLGAAIAAALLGRLLGHSLVYRSVQQLSAAAERLSRGDFSARVPASRAGDELASVADSFNTMAEALAERETSLRDSEERHRDVVELMRVGIWVHTDDRVVFANQHAARMFGAAAPDDLIGRGAMTFVHPEDRGRTQDRMRQMIEGGTVQLPLTEVRLLRLDGSTLLAEVQAIRFVRNGRIHVMATAYDVTAYRAAEDQLRQSQKMESVGRLTGGVAHDFNNILTIIIGNLDAVIDRAPLSLRRPIDNALQAAERAATLTQRLLAFSRRQPLDPEQIDLNRLVFEMDDMLRRTLGEDVEIATTLAAGLWPAMADRGQVENALLNLVVNARDAMPEGGKLTIETADVHLDEAYAARNSEVAPGDYVMLAVTDTGGGMPPDVVERAIEPFFTTKAQGKGTGLGLSMIFGFAKQSRGHLKIYSEVGHGTTVRLYLPRAAADTSVGARIPAPVEHQRGAETILVVEDDAAVRQLVVAQLQDLGYAVLEAADGPSARVILDGDVAIDLLFTDVVMPGGITGRKLAGEAVLRRPGLRTLFTSGYTENSIVHQGRLDPGVHLLSKPYKKRDLARKLREVLDAPPTRAGGRD